MQRRSWKLDLIARVEARIHAAPVEAPGRERWDDVTAASDEYRRVVLRGVFLPDRPALVQAVTAYGPGFWVLSALRRPDGETILVNRGFVPAERSRDTASWAAPAGETQVTGLLRVSEPGGAFLRANDPASERWYSRDVAAIAASRGLGAVAPYFIDVEHAPGAATLPVGGLTVIVFRNHHLVYAMTWYGLAALLVTGTVRANLGVLRRRTPQTGPT